MTFNYKYSLGVYVNRHFASSGGEGNPHVFLGLKREKVKCNEGQIQIQKDVYQHYLKHNMLEQANQCKINIEQMQCFKQESTLEDLRKKLSEKWHERVYPSILDSKDTA